MNSSHDDDAEATILNTRTRVQKNLALDLNDMQLWLASHSALNHQIMTTKSQVNPFCFSAGQPQWLQLQVAQHDKVIPTKIPPSPSFRVACGRAAELVNMAESLSHSDQHCRLASCYPCTLYRYCFSFTALVYLTELLKVLDSDSDSLFSKFYKESVSKAVSIQT